MKRLVMVAAAVVVLAALAAGLFALTRSSKLEGPVPVTWDREVCAFCRMHVGEPGFAVQLQTVDGQVLNFDDTGCYFRYVAREKPQIAAAYFHHAREDRWLSRDAVRFERVRQSPMGFGLAAVEAGPLTLSQGRQHCLEADPAHKHPPNAPSEHAGSPSQAPEGHAPGHACGKGSAKQPLGDTESYAGEGAP